VPDITALPSGSEVFVDTMIFCLHFAGKSATCSAFMQRIARGEIRAYVNVQVLSDLIHKLMLAEAFTKRLIPQRRAEYLKRALSADRSLSLSLGDYQVQLKNTISLGIMVLPKLLIETFKERHDHGLMTGDSIHLGNMNRFKNRIRDIVTHDGDFLHIPNITVWTPMDVV
jgi:predicted nucleic acid-binding protein